jgi:hypothetical protein
MHWFAGHRPLQPVRHPPQSQRVEHRRQIPAGIRQPVPDLAPGVRRRASDDPGGLEQPEPVGEARGGDVIQAALEVAEPFPVEQQVADDQQRPALANHVHGSGHHAEVPIGAIGVHGTEVATRPARSGSGRRAAS